MKHTRGIQKVLSLTNLKTGQATECRFFSTKSSPSAMHSLLWSCNFPSL